MNLTRDSFFLQTGCTRAYLYTSRDAPADGEPEDGRGEGPQKQQGPWEGGGALRVEGRTVVGLEGRETTQCLFRYTQPEGNERRVAQLLKQNSLDEEEGK